MRICPALCSHPRRSSEKEGSWDVLTTTSHWAVHHPRGERKLTPRNSATTHLLSTGSWSALWRVWNDFLHTVPYWNIPRRQQLLTLTGRQTQRNNKGQKRYGISHGHQHTHKFTGKYFSVNTNLRHFVHRNKTSTYLFGLTQARIHHHHSHTFVHGIQRSEKHAAREQQVNSAWRCRVISTLVFRHGPRQHRHSQEQNDRYNLKEEPVTYLSNPILFLTHPISFLPRVFLTWCHLGSKEQEIWLMSLWRSKTKTTLWAVEALTQPFTTAPANDWPHHDDLEHDYGSPQSLPCDDKTAF